MYSAATPAAAGAAIDVPLQDAVRPPGTGATMEVPGAYRSTQPPVDELVARASSIVELATTKTSGADRGAAVQSSPPELPAEVTTNTPASTRPSTAASTTSEGP